MRWILTTFYFLTSLFFCNALLAQEHIMPNGDFEGMKRTGVFKVTEIVNPLTVKLEDGRFVHLAGLNFADLDFYEPGDLSITAMHILDDFLKGKKVTLYQTKNPSKGRKTRMDHHIGHLVRTDNDIWVQGMLLSLGVARVRTTPYNPDMAKQMLSLENTARKAKSGMWDIEEHRVLSPKEAAKHIGSYQIVEGVVNTVSMRKNKLYLNFGKNWRDDFTIAISAFNLRKFTKQKLSPQQWNGKRLRVRGWIGSYNGPYMDIDHPERFEAIFEQKNTMQTSAEKPAAPAPKKQNQKPRKKDPGSALPVFND
ncbi:MAG: hypothetical protein COB36_01075 [Alphaproteobacteria bacterium]|nr:MAG: hypothetical protein COB36_01075 [Alphaproteobacteria bacterium]